MRKLATAALAFSAAVFLANYALPVDWLLVPAVLSAVLGALLALFHRPSTNVPDRNRTCAHGSGGHCSIH